MQIKNSFAAFMAILATSLLLLAACGNPEPEPEPEPEPDPGFTTSVSIPEFELSLAGPDEAQNCDQSEKPEDVGCTTICKPCKTSICVDGEWQSMDVKPPKEICEPRPGGLPPRGCPLGENRFCPAECHICY